MTSSLFEALTVDRTRAAAAEDANARLGALATCGADGQPRVRTVVVHAVADDALLLLISRHHGKWRQLAHEPRAELMIWWAAIGLQYRLAGLCEEAPPEVAEERWRRLPEAARRLDLAYGPGFLPGDPVVDREVAREQVERRSAPLDTSAMPAHVCALRPRLTEIERLALSPGDRVHDRRRAVRVAGAWKTTTLVP